MFPANKTGFPGSRRADGDPGPANGIDNGFLPSCKRNQKLNFTLFSFKNIFFIVLVVLIQL
jgi:hypothetical protein